MLFYIFQSWAWSDWWSSLARHFGFIFILDYFLNIRSFWDMKLQLQIFWYIVELWWCIVPAFFTLSILPGNADYHTCENCFVTLSYYCSIEKNFELLLGVLQQVYWKLSCAPCMKKFQGDLYQWPVSHFLLASSIQYCSICRCVLFVCVCVLQWTFSAS